MNGYLHVAGEGNVGLIMRLLDAAGLPYAPAAPDRKRDDAVASLHVRADGWGRGDWEALVRVMDQVLRSREPVGQDGPTSATEGTEGISA